MRQKLETDEFLFYLNCAVGFSIKVWINLASVSH